ncbi:MAG: hypothetical protein Q9163_006417 [Psora crenata]
MATSAIAIQREIILNAIRSTGVEWKVLVLDTGSRRLVDNVVGEDDILKENVTNIEQIEDRRAMNQQMDATYVLSPLPHIVDCLMSDFERRRYRRSFIMWTTLLPPEQRERLDKSAMARDSIALLKVLNIDFYPRESNLLTFRDPWSFPTLFHPTCNQLIRKHMDELAQRIVSVCVSLGEYPTIRYHKPQDRTHEASVLCSHLAHFVQLEMDRYARYHEDFPPPSPRPQGTLIITDRSMDLFSPLVHEFTYQAMVHDLLPLTEGDKIYYKTSLGDKGAVDAVKNVEISEKDGLWVDNRHLHMKDLLETLSSKFEEFTAKYPQFAESDNPSSLNNIKDMLAGLPEYLEGKEAISLHLNMVTDAMSICQRRKLVEIASVEQSMATGLDEEFRKPRNVADQVVRLLDESDVTFPDRLRLIMQYILYRNGLLPSDTQRLLAHAQLPARDAEVIYNLELIGAHVSRTLKDPRPVAQPPFWKKQALTNSTEGDSELSRYNPVIKTMLEEHIQGTLDRLVFPFTKPHLDTAEGLMGRETTSQASLRSAKPTWARPRPTALEPRQRIIVFMAGGATYSESRACYEISKANNKDIFLASSHMLTPELFLRQVGDLSVDKRRLNLPADQPRPQAPAHLFEREPIPVEPPIEQASDIPRSSQMPLVAIENLSLTANGRNNPLSQPIASLQAGTHSDANSTKDKGKDKDRKKRHHFFGSRK